jgi:hypothetical protein
MYWYKSIGTTPEYTHLFRGFDHRGSLFSGKRKETFVEFTPQAHAPGRDLFEKVL